MKRITNLKHNYMRTFFALLAVWLTATTAWATDITRTYKLYWTGGELSADGYVQQEFSPYNYDKWHVGVQTLWPANESSWC